MPRTSRAPVLVVGGWGLVGAQAVTMLRRRHPDLPILLGGRRPENGADLAARIGAGTVALELGASAPLDQLPVAPRAVLAAVSDPGDHLLVDSMRRNIPIADINRASSASVLDVTLAATHEQPTTPVLLAGGWMAGASALCAAAVTVELGRPCSRLDIVSLSSSEDRIGDDSWGFSERLPWVFWTMRSGRRRVVSPLSDLAPTLCADGVVRPAGRVGTLEQTTLPVTLGVPTVETRLALHSNTSLYLLAGLKRSGALRMLADPRLAGVRARVLQRSGSGDVAGLSVSATSVDGVVNRWDLLDVRGQSHLSAVGAVRAIEQVLSGTLPAGISFPEQFARPADDLQALREAGVVVHATRTGQEQFRTSPMEVLA